jgi:2-iminobutanoate/2-iminopropanoate deaminase
MVKILEVSTLDAPAAIGPYSQAVTVVDSGGLLFISGRIPLNAATGELVGADIKAQIEQVFTNIEVILKSRGFNNY